MVSILRSRKLCYVEPVRCFQSFEAQSSDKKNENNVTIVEKKRQQKKKSKRECSKEWRRCIDHCCWMTGYMCTTWWLLCFLYSCMPATLPGFQNQIPESESSGARLSREGVTVLHPVVLIPGIVTGGLELWEGKPCAEGLFRKRLWSGSFAEIHKRPLCWLEHLSLNNETGLDPPGIRVRAAPGLVAADHFASESDYFVWEVLIENLARIGYEGKNLYMAAYDWRLSFQNTEIRDQALSKLKSQIELMFVTNGYKKVVVVPHSMGAIYFLHFLKWVEIPPPTGGGGGPGWCAKHIKAIMNVSPAFLGVPKAVTNIFSAEGKDVTFVRAVATGILNFDYLDLQKLEHVIRVCKTWDSIVSLMPKGGKTIWGDLDWSPEEENNSDKVKDGYVKHFVSDKTYNGSEMKKGLQVKEEPMKYGRIISFGNAVSQLPGSLLSKLDSEEISGKSSATLNLSCEDMWTEYDEMSRESTRKVAKKMAYTARTVFDLLHFLAPKMMKRAEAHFSRGIAENLDDPKYAHHKYWSNPLETKLPDAPDMEMYCLYGAGIPTEKCSSIPFQIDSSADGGGGEGYSCLQNGEYFVDGDESVVPVVSAGFMCAKGWRGRTRFNPSGMATYVREYQHSTQSGSFLDQGRSVERGSRANFLMGNVALIEDVLRVAAGSTGADIGGDRIYSDIRRMSETIDLRL